MPRPVQGFRIVKPRTQNQQQHAGVYGRERPDSVTVILSRDAGFPSESWWTEPRTRDSFAQSAQREQKRMEISRFGRTNGDNVL